MGRSVQVAEGAFVALPNGHSYQDGETVMLTDEEWSHVSPAALDAEIILDLGPTGDSGSGQGFDFITKNSDDEPSGTEGQTWLHITQSTSDYLTWSQGTVYLAGAIVQPTAPNGHSYAISADGTSGADEPVWPTDGGTVEDNDLTWLDNGLISAGNPPLPQGMILFFHQGAWLPMFAGMALGDGYAQGVIQIEGGPTFSQLDDSGVQRTVVAEEVGTFEVDHYDGSGQQVGVFRANAGETLLAGSGLDDAPVIVVGGVQALGFFGASAIEAADRPVVNDISDLDALKDYLVSIGLLQGGG